ncbi:unnamed protein product [Aphanomyces euteiches]|nr:hypothetical protein AeRB84_001961 [Aphanomyces euteiches]
MKIIVVGGGIVGLSTALALLEHGFLDVKIVADSFDDTTSHVAGAVWRPVFAGSTSDYTMDRWGHETMLWLRGLIEHYGTDVVGCKRTPGMELQDTPIESHPYWAHSVEDFRLLTPEEALKHAPYTKKYGCVFTSIMIHPGVLMDWITKQIQARGGTFERRHVSSLNDLDADIIVNCTGKTRNSILHPDEFDQGVNAGKLVNDANVYPVRGQVIKVINPAITRFITVESHGQYTYILPRHNGEVTLGGTAQPHNWSTENDQDDVKQIMERCIALMPEVKDSKVLFAKAGLRPTTTTGTRVELDAKRTATGAWIVHNYGHGGSGHTIHRGCASDVVQIIRSLHAKL